MIDKNPLDEEDNFDALDAGGGDEWQVTYLDTVTILLAFFIILSSFADMDMALMMGKKDPKITDEEEQTDPGNERVLFYPIQALGDRLEENMWEEIERGILSLDKKDYEIRMLFSGNSFFNLGEAELLPEGKAIVKRIIMQLAKLERRDFKVDVEGHTDSAPIRTVRFKNNWELSAARAAGVVSSFLDEGISADKLKASGYADTFRLAEDRDENGRFLPEEQNKNRRIVIRLYYD
ncbi:MAG: flagellar motor protein MotB [Bacteroidia bacterium]